MYIEENRNGDICLVDFYVGVVIIINRVGEFRFWYDGIILFKMDVKFCLIGIVIDSLVYIFVFDFFKVYIIDENG